MSAPTIIIKDRRFEQQSSEASLDFEIHNVDVSVVNSLRRIMWAEVPTVAIDLVEFYINDSPLHDEFIAHRLGMIPINSAEHCMCDSGCKNCQVEYYLDVKCTDDKKIITTNNFTSESDNRFPLLPDVVIVELARNQRLRLKAIARKGVGMNHAKWTPSVALSIKPHTEIKINKDKMDTLSYAEMQSFVACCPTKVYKYEDGIVDVEDTSRCTYCGECMVPKYAEFVSVKQKPRSFTFHVETTGALRPETIVRTSFEILNQKLKEMLR